MNVDGMSQSHRETKVKYETDLTNLREQVCSQKFVGKYSVQCELFMYL